MANYKVGQFEFNAIGDLVSHPTEFSLTELKAAIEELTQQGSYIAASRLNNMLVEIQMQEVQAQLLVPNSYSYIPQ
ncbi:hypothetical protein NMS42_002420 [Vibrio cholerae]|nr:hypothetical protein [Vibrio cholerae]